MQSVSYMGDGSTTEFMFNFPYYENSNIIVTVNNTAASGYTIVGTSAGVNADIPYSGGKVVFDVAPTALDSIIISRSLTLARIVDYQPTAKLDPTILNQDINYVMEVLKDIKDEFDNLSAKYAEIANKESTTTLLARIDEISDEIGDVNETITDFNTDIENGRIMSKDDFYTYTTNCITENPQNIKLSLSNGTITLSSGSKITFPDGTTYVLNSNQTTTNSNNGTRIIFCDSVGHLDSGYPLNRIGSGPTLPANNNNYSVFYNTTDGKIYTWQTDHFAVRVMSLPIAIITVSNGAISSVNQIFNGFGYIGSTLFALSGIKVLAPNGFNKDGSLNNTTWTNTGLITYTQTTGSETIDISINTTNNSFELGSYTYNSDENYNYCDGTVCNNNVIIGSVTFTSGVITSTTFKKVLSLKLN